MYKRREYRVLKSTLRRSAIMRRSYDWTINLDRAWRVYDKIIRRLRNQENLESKFLKNLKYLELNLPNLVDDKVTDQDKVIFNIGNIKDYKDREEHTSVMRRNKFFDLSGTVYRRGLFMFDGDIGYLRYLLIRFLKGRVKRMYRYVHVPTMVSENMMINTGQLPKFKDIQFKVEEGWYLSPTGEVQLGNLPVDHPGDYTTLSKCFRNEVNYGKRGKGLVRNLEFEKMELFSYSEPWRVDLKFRKMLILVSRILSELGIPHRVLRLSAYEASWSAKITYDFETWLPESKHYLELSSVSDCGEYQSRRRGLRFKFKDGKTYHPCTLNGSCLPIGRTLVALIEHHGLKGAMKLLSKLLKIA